MSIFLGILTFLLIIVSLFIVLVVLAQKSKDGGMGSALGGGAVEATFGGEAGNVLTRWTIGAAVCFFVLTFALYLGRIYESKHVSSSGAGALPTIAVPAAPAPVTGASPATSSAPLTVPSTAPTTGTAAPATATPTAPAPEAKKQP